MAVNILPETIGAVEIGTRYSANLLKKKNESSTDKIASVQIIIAGTATAKVQVSNNGTTWADLTAGDTASASYKVDAKYTWIRGNVTAWTSGDVDIFVETE